MEAADTWERDRRREDLRETTWKLVPRKLLGMPCAAPLADAVDAWQGGSLALLGPGGIGKTTAALRLVARLCRLGVDQGGDAFELARRIFWTRNDTLTNAGGAPDDESSKHILRRAELCRLLVLDDLSSEPSKTFLRILQSRYDAGRDTVVTCGELNERDFARRIGGAGVFRWLLEGGRVRGKVVIA